MNTDETRRPPNAETHTYYDLRTQIVFKPKIGVLIVIYGAYIAKRSTDPVDLILWDLDVHSYTTKKRTELPMRDLYTRDNDQAGQRTLRFLRDLGQLLTQTYTCFALDPPT